MSYKLLHNNVDDYPQIIEEWNEKPTKEELTEIFVHYYDDDVVDELVEGLLTNDYHDMNDSENNHYEFV